MLFIWNANFCLFFNRIHLFIDLYFLTYRKSNAMPEIDKIQELEFKTLIINVLNFK
ncbi:hypothetical protein GFO_0727 [Christiangramia forsetii KT0803]|uniref:Uncharacterized protein n=1 Tax=Christiangramia forsetii (strain DSM 17595 / CGMCC 1.15422 / KT0803) TaxID=411154 RepID=A0LZA9_CHRFK|nr:hypothetical protein GFO_0727 [Christiangramia forsetii KT0803]